MFDDVLKLMRAVATSMARIQQCSSVVNVATIDAFVFEHPSRYGFVSFEHPSSQGMPKLSLHARRSPVLEQLPNGLQSVPLDGQVQTPHAVLIDGLDVHASLAQQELDHLTPVSEAGHVEGLMLQLRAGTRVRPALLDQEPCVSDCFTYAHKAE